MIAGAESLATMLLLPIALVDLIFLLETVLGLWPTRIRVAAPRDKQVVVLVPAHEEAGTLTASGAVLARLLGPNTQVLVVADNCLDETASISRALGLEVVERHDATRRGKGYALAFGRSHVAASPPDVVVVLDADCEITPTDLSRLADTAMSADRSTQAAYVFRPSPAAPPVVQISNFGFMVKNLVRQRGIRRLGGAAILTGSGMAFPWRSFAKLNLATGNVVEDLAIGISLIEMGEAPMFFEGATVLSECSSDAGSQTQRARWESGFIGMARGHAFSLFTTGLRRGDWRRVWMGLHLIVPPLSILLAGNALVMIVAAIAALVGAGAMPLVVTAGLFSLLGLAIASAWILDGQAHLTRGAALRLPLYLVWKLVIFTRILSGRQKVEWTRTDRVGP